MALSNLDDSAPYFLTGYGVRNKGDDVTFFRFDFCYSSTAEGHLGDGDFNVVTSFEGMCFHFGGK
jgi:hypothetical protein